MEKVMDKVEFKGFEPDNNLKSTISRTFDIILGSAPSDSEPLARLQRTADGFKGFLRLSSTQGIFSAEATGREAAEMVSRLRDRIFEQIGVWRGGRRLLGSNKK